MAYPPPLQPEYYTPDPVLPAGRATASMVCGILAVVMLCAFFPLALPLAIVAVALGARARRDVRLGTGGGFGQATAGMVCGSIVLALFALALVLLMIAAVVSVIGGH